ncbi:hypothetical protein CQ393_16990 [Stenotrophomonas sp. MYb238]|uniref:hypothetical protein n=1 Tax=Stenotrophomonas sp. MYb238 TaxID=2040281 RepID=UPI001292637B|nr:hypothetical protein [Stenotrophomonas sp. MYb238]MQP77578.1 hypothetical protein [Stenotrophomonas sp. MYb238]
MVLAGVAQAQQAPPPVEDPAPAVDAAPPPAEGVRTLEEVRALKPEDDQPLDLYRFRNPVKVESNRFSRSWSEPPTPEQVSLSGGYLMMGINYGLMAAAKGLHTLTGGRDQIQSAVARPPPELSQAQRSRALRFCAQQEDCAAPPGN